MARRPINLANFEAYLRLLAELFLDRHSRLRSKLDAADIVQQTLLRAHQHRRQCRGLTEAERKAWLRQILTNVVRNHVRHFLVAARRDLQGEVSLDEAAEQSSAPLEAWLATERDSPCQEAERNEQMEQLARALETLPEA